MKFVLQSVGVITGMLVLYNLVKMTEQSGDDGMIRPCDENVSHPTVNIEPIDQFLCMINRFFKKFLQFSEGVWCITYVLSWLLVFSTRYALTYSLNDGQNVLSVLLMSYLASEIGVGAIIPLGTALYCSGERCLITSTSVSRVRWFFALYIIPVCIAILVHGIMDVKLREFPTLHTITYHFTFNFPLLLLLICGNNCSSKEITSAKLVYVFVGMFCCVVSWYVCFLWWKGTRGIGVIGSFWRGWNEPTVRFMYYDVSGCFISTMLMIQHDFGWSGVKDVLFLGFLFSFPAAVAFKYAHFSYKRKAV